MRRAWWLRPGAKIGRALMDVILGESPVPYATVGRSDSGMSSSGQEDDELLGMRAPDQLEMPRHGCAAYAERRPM